MIGISLLDFRRAFSRRWAVGFWPRLFEFVFQPIFVAVIVCLAFLAKEKESAIPAFANAFFYFTGLYAFWVGLFGSCQSLNGEVHNGEWSYWTLGLRRYIPGHVLSVLGVNLVCALWNVALFIVSVVAISHFLPSCKGFNPFVSCFLTQNPAQANSIWQCGYMLKPLLIAKHGVCGPLLFATGVYSLSLFAATICGVCFGMFLSLLPDPEVSLNASVAFVVLLGMISLLGLQGDKSRNRESDNNHLDSCFATRFESQRIVNKSSGLTATDILVAFSRFLPQRYFFNIARMPLKKDMDEAVKNSICNELCQRANVSMEEPDAWWWKEEPTSTNQGCCKWGLGTSEALDVEKIEDLAVAIGKFKDESTGKSFSEKYRTLLWNQLFRRAIWLELAPLVWMCLICLFIVNAGVLTLPPYRRLR